MRRTPFYVLFFSLFLSFSSYAAELLPFKLSIRPSLSEIHRFKGGGKDHLVFEIFVENFENKALQIESLSIRVQNLGKDFFVKELRGEELARSFSLINESYMKAQQPVLQPGVGGIFFIFIDLPASVGKADSIVNSLEVQSLGSPSSRMTLQAGSLKINPKLARVVSPPLRGKYWWSPNAPANNTIHRRIVIPFDATISMPERFATDWIRLGEDGKNFSGPANQNSSYHAYGAQLLAVAPGKVVALKDGIPENTPTSPTMAVPITLETIGGNHVIIDIGDGLYAFYAHIQPGKIAVKLGDVVKTGDVVGLLGNSGNSTEPHLHFHLIDRPDPLIGQGQPYLFDRFTRLLGDVKLNAEGDPIGMNVTGEEIITNQAYMNLELIHFAE